MLNDRHKEGREPHRPPPFQPPETGEHHLRTPVPAGNAPGRQGIRRRCASDLRGYFFPHLVPAPLHPRFGPQQAVPQVTFGLPPFVNPHGGAVVGAGVVVVVPPVHAWSMPQEESFWQVWHNSPLLPQLALLVPAEHAPVEVQQPARTVPKLQGLQNEPPVPQTKEPS